MKKIAIQFKEKKKSCSKDHGELYNLGKKGMSKMSKEGTWTKLVALLMLGCLRMAQPSFQN